MLAGLTSRWGWYWVRGFPNPGRAPKCKTQNSGLRSKEEKPAQPNKPAQQMQRARGFIVGCANRVTLISWEAEHTEQQIGQAFYRQKPFYQHITYGYKVIGYMFAILLVQTSRAFVQT